MRQRPVLKKARIRIYFALIIVSLAYIGLFSRLAWIQLYKGAEYESMASENRFNEVTLSARRGAVYDTEGRPLAISVMTESVYAIPIEVAKSKQTARVAGELAKILDMDQAELSKKLNDNANKWFLYIKRKITEEQAEQIRELKLPGICFQEEPMRIYPQGTLMANVIGFVGMDNVGLSGFEVAYDNVLSGAPGKLMVEQDHKGRSIPDAAKKLIPSQDGASVTLTIDETIQYILEREIAKAVEKYHPEKIGMLVMDPNTGQVLGMAQYPTFNPNEFGNYDAKNWRNFLISDAYEPGSTFKTVVMAGAIEEGLVALDEKFTCNGYVELTSGTVRCWRGLRHGSQTFIEGAQNSCNPMFVRIGLRMGKETFYKYLRGFGFGAKTGIELAGEATGILMPQRSCRELDLATMSIGQSNAVTPIQLLNAFCAVANGGKLMRPQIVKEIRGADGEIIMAAEPEVIRQVISQATSVKVMSVLEQVVSSGTGKTAYIDGFRVGGKTGTAQKIQVGLGYSEKESIVSFIGAAPANDPQVACLIVMDNPIAESVTGGATCGPIFQAAMKDVLKYMKIPAQVTPGNVVASSLDEVIIPDFTIVPLASAERIAEAQGLRATVIGTGNNVRAQLPLANTKTLKGSKILLYTDLPKSADKPLQVTVPRLTGVSGAELTRIEREHELQFRAEGSGIVVYQQPGPGVTVSAGSMVMIKLEEPWDDLKPELAGP